MQIKEVLKPKEEDAKLNKITKNKRKTFYNIIKLLSFNIILSFVLK